MLRAEALLKEAGFRLRLVPAPPQAGELCTTAIAVPASEGVAAVDLLKERTVLLKGILTPEEAVVGAPHSLHAEMVTGLAGHPGLDEVVEKVAAGEGLGRREVLALLELEGGEETLCRVAEAMAAALSGREAVPAVVLDLSGEKVGRSIEPLRGLAKEMSSLGLVYLILSLEERGGLPWSAQEFREAVGGEVVTVIQAGRLPRRPEELVRDYGVRQILLRRDDLYRMTPVELADEVMFLRDNRPGPVGSGNLIPLFSGSLPGGDEGVKRLRRTIAVLRLALEEAFFPVPESLWRQGELCGGNLLLLERTTGGLERALREAEDAVRAGGWSVRKAGRVA